MAMVTSKKPARRPSTSSSESGTRSKTAPPAEPLPAQLDPETEGRVYALVRRVAEQDGLVIPPEWVLEADQAKRRGYLNENNLRLFMTLHGRQWIASKDESPKRRGPTMQKLSPKANLQLKDLSNDTGVPMKEVVSDLIGAVHENRDRLTRYARKHGAEHPWEAIPHLLAAARV